MAKMFIQKAIKRPGALHRALKVPEGENIPVSKIKEAAANPARFKKGKRAQTLLRRQANFALTLRKLRK